ncbi:hypothetical protein KIPB_000152 [Kipferlia bialata]|uniref:Thioredoxin domain-containing protein n=1 Tax=Kipferlia bialata TaxID=797122 RepID=A0A9K3CLU5_9EUKA|nr:hypothetical protein KIPB_000152 [Kipferlia bialata]|eukprot:g152.t1
MLGQVQCDTSGGAQYYEWLTYLGQCVEVGNVAYLVSFTCGLLSVMCWIVAQFPQILKNYRLQSVSSISYAFLINWIIGDVTNCLGAILTNALPTQIISGIYFCLVDVVLFTQFQMYRETKDKAERIGLLYVVMVYDATLQPEALALMEEMEPLWTKVTGCAFFSVDVNDPENVPYVSNMPQLPMLFVGVDNEPKVEVMPYEWSPEVVEAYLEAKFVVPVKGILPRFTNEEDMVDAAQTEQLPVLLSISCPDCKQFDINASKVASNLVDNTLGYSLQCDKDLDTRSFCAAFRVPSQGRRLCLFEDGVVTCIGEQTEDIIALQDWVLGEMVEERRVERLAEAQKVVDVSEAVDGDADDFGIRMGPDGMPEEWPPGSRPAAMRAKLTQLESLVEQAEARVAELEGDL